MRTKLTCSPLEENEADAFIAAEHRQGALKRKQRTKNLGLYADGELVGVLQVGLTRTSRMKERYSLEIYRLAFARGRRFPGGASKLIKNYIRLYNPSDFFTYQDTTGDNTLVYQHAGMTLVEDGLKRTKQYLVAPGKTLATASRREALGMAYATRYGPDRILGTKLGEVMDPDTGKRKPNRRIFLEDLGWHEETTTGDSLWEWVAPDRTYYTYRITASDSDKYYFGVSHVKKANATVEDCLGDGYWGSGGKQNAKYSNWKRKHAEQLQKEVLKTFSRKVPAYKAEKELVGNRYKTDPLCLNSAPGGILQPHVAARLGVAACPVHGMTAHNGGTCLRCVSQAAHSVMECSIHGPASFFGGRCQRCVSLDSKREGVCPVHGTTSFQGDTCYRCMSASILAVCKKHGSVPHYGGKCMTCTNSEKVTVAECPLHGEVKHIGSKCYVCVSTASVSLKECSVHGVTKHRGDKCFRCRGNNQALSEKECAVHGLTTHKADQCVKCTHGKMISVRTCSVHGETKHRGESCFRCSAAKRKKA